MLGIFKGLMITLRHAFKPKWTQIYPYEKPKLPERSRGLIQLTTEEETGTLRCEACLMCEKVCPPRAITIAYKDRGAFRNRPLFRPRTVNGFYRRRMALTAPYEGKLVPSAVDVAEAKGAIDAVKVERILTKAMEEDWGLLAILEAIQMAIGYVPQAAAKQVSEATGVEMSDIYAIMTLDPTVRVNPTGPAPVGEPKNRSERLNFGDGNG